MPTTERASAAQTTAAHVESVMPRLGLAYVTDGKRLWGVSRSVLGSGFDALTPGQPVRLHLQSERGVSLVRACEADG